MMDWSPIVTTALDMQAQMQKNHRDLQQQHNAFLQQYSQLGGLGQAANGLSGLANMAGAGATCANQLRAQQGVNAANIFGWQVFGSTGLGALYGIAQGTTRTAGQGNQRDTQRETVPEKLDRSDAKDEQQARIASGKERLTLKNSPLFGKAAFGMFYNWTSIPPFAEFFRRLQWKLWRWVRS
jgi:hypothetical protein